MQHQGALRVCGVHIGEGGPGRQPGPLGEIEDRTWEQTGPAGSSVSAQGPDW